MDFFGIDLISLIRATGYIGIFAMIFAESSFFVFLPGDSLLFAAGLLASQGYFFLPLLMAVCFIGAVSGNTAGYAIGKWIGPKIFTQESSLLFSPKNIGRAQNFYSRYGSKAITYARFVPAARTFIPILAGVAGMHYRSFLLYNVAGGLLWAVGLPLIGYYLGATIPDVDRYLLPIIVLIIVLSFIPVFVHFLKTRSK